MRANTTEARGTLLGLTCDCNMPVLTVGDLKLWTVT